MISVLMCTYNREEYLRRAIDSVLNQTYGDLEFIIVDDGSTDGSESLIKEYKDDRIRYYPLERNSYYCYAANYGLQYCSGQYVAFMNSDDIWLPNKLEKQIDFMESHKDYGACFSAVALIDDQEQDVTDECWQMRDLFARQYASQKDCLSFLLKYGNSLCHPSALVRKELLNKVGTFNLMYCQLADYDLWIRIVSETPIHVLEERLVQFRWDMKKKDQISIATKENSVRAFNEQILIRKQLVERLTDEKFLRFFGDQFKNSKSASHLELEFERAFLLEECMSEAPGLKVLGIEKLEQVMRQPGAMETLRGHFGMDIFDLYCWNKEHIYKDPWLMAEFTELEQTIRHQGNLMKQMQQQMNEKSQQIDEKNQQIGERNRQISEKDRQIGILSTQVEQQGQLIEVYANSTSWKVTEPLRKLMRWFKR